ncbi:MAG: IMP cyclohydrolase [Candidatus Sumerlaeota bacterium]
MANPIKTALLSVHDKSGLAEIAQHLAQLGVTMYATGGTFRALHEVQIKAIPVNELTQSPEMMDGRVKTLHPAVFSGILSRRDSSKDMETLRAHQLDPIDLVIVNTRPFSQAAKNSDLSEQEVLEHIDIGGPAMMRAAAKNWQSVAIVCDPADYDDILREMLNNDGALSDATRRRLALKAFRLTQKLDSEIIAFLEEGRRPIKE